MSQQVLAPSQPTAQRPSSAPNTRVRLRQYNQLVQQLTNTVAETKRPPPAGADLEVIATRRTKLERVLRDVQESISATKKEQKEHQDGRYKKAILDQVGKEQRFKDENDEQENRSKRNAKDFWNYTMGRRRHHNETLNKRTADAFVHLEDNHTNRVQRNYDSAVKRQEKLQKMADRQSQIRASSAKQRQSIREHTEMLYQRKLEKDALLQKKNDEDALARKQDYDRRSRVAEEKKKQRAQSTDAHRAVAKKKGTFDFEAAFEESERRRLDQHHRYLHAERVRAAERQRKKQLDQVREARRDGHYLDLCDRHEVEGHRIKAKLAQQSDHVAMMRQTTEQRMLASRKQRNQTILNHQQKAVQRWNEKIDVGFQGNYTRWTRRADHVMAKIIGSYESLAAPETRDGGVDGDLSGVMNGGDTSSGVGGEGSKMVADQSMATTPHRQQQQHAGHRSTVNIVTPSSAQGNSMRRRLPASSS